MSFTGLSCRLLQDYPVGCYRTVSFTGLSCRSLQDCELYRTIYGQSFDQITYKAKLYKDTNVPSGNTATHTPSDSTEREGVSKLTATVHTDQSAPPGSTLEEPQLLTDSIEQGRNTEVQSSRSGSSIKPRFPELRPPELPTLALARAISWTSFTAFNSSAPPCAQRVHSQPLLPPRTEICLTAVSELGYVYTHTHTHTGVWRTHTHTHTAVQRNTHTL